MTTQLSPEMSLLLSKMTEQLNIQTNTLTENITAAVLQKVEEKIKPLFEENEKLKSEVEKLNKKIQTLETNNKRNNIILHGLPESKKENHEDLTALVTSTLKEIDVKLQNGEIDRLQRLGKRGVVEGKIRPILLGTTTLQKKILILKNKKKLKSNIYITHDLPKAVLEIRKDKWIKYKNDNNESIETSSPGSQSQNKNHSKVERKDTFQPIRERPYPFSDKSMYRNKYTNNRHRTIKTTL